MKILVTGSAGFIGSALSMYLLRRGDSVVGIDNHNDYYEPQLKESRLARHLKHPNYTHYRLDLCDKCELAKCFNKEKPERVVNLAAQAGVRYSIENPLAYINSNIVGFAHILENCRDLGVDHLVYASSSSVYGANTKLPFSVDDNVDHPLSLYAATKKSNELMAHSYSHLFELPTTGLRFFTVYGPWGRPDMALFKFTRAIFEGKPVDVYNYGAHKRDFTYIDDIIEGVIKVLDQPAKPNHDWPGTLSALGSSKAPWRVYNIGNHSPVPLMEFISALERSIGKKAILNMLPMQPGDVQDTFADVTDLEKMFAFKPSTLVVDGVQNFVNWYRDYYSL